MNFTEESSRGLTFLNGIRFFHWTTYSYTKHKILDELYEDFSKKLDELLEALLSLEREFRTDLENYGSYNMNEFSSELDLVKFMILYYKIKKDEDIALQNVLADIVQLLGKAKYLLEIS